MLIIDGIVENPIINYVFYLRFLLPNICFVVCVKIKKFENECKDAFLVSDGWLQTFITLLGSLVSLARRHKLCDIDMIWRMPLITTNKGKRNLIYWRWKESCI